MIKTKIFTVILLAISFVFFAPQNLSAQKLGDWLLRDVIVSSTQEGPALKALLPGQTVYISAVLTNTDFMPPKNAYISLYINNVNYNNGIKIDYPGWNNTSKILLCKLTVDPKFIANNKFTVRANLEGDANALNNSVNFSIPVKTNISDWQIDDLIVSVVAGGDDMDVLIPNQKIWVDAVITNNGNSPAKTVHPEIYINDALYKSDIQITCPAPGVTARINLLNINLDPQFIKNKFFKVKVNLHADDDKDNSMKETGIPVF